MRMGGRILIGCVIWALLAVHGARAQDALTARVTPLTLSPRSDAPIPVTVDLTWRGSRLLEGTLEITVESYESPRIVARFPDIALTNGSQSFRLLLPQPAVGQGDELGARVRFLARGEAIALGAFPLRARFGGPDPTRVLAVCSERGTGSTAWPQVTRSFQAGRFIPQSAGGKRPAGTFPVSIASIEPDDLPSDALAYCGFDLLDGAALARVRSRQLAALASWVRAGGSLGIFGVDALDSDRVRLLNDLAGPARGVPFFTQDAAGRVASTLPVVLRHAGFGRLAVVPRLPADDAGFDGPEWRRLVAFLWRFRESQIHEIVTDGAVKLVTDSPAFNRAASESAIERKRAESVRDALGRLTPETTRLIPRSAIVAILGFFVLVVGPGEWFVLGWMRRRRFTWITFPLAAASATLLTIASARHYFGEVEHRARLVVSDIGADGRIVRESRFEMRLPAGNRPGAEEVHRALAMPSGLLSVDRYGAFGDEPESNAVPAYEGRHPDRFVIRQQLRQWTPTLTRITSFEPRDDDSGIRWDTLNPDSAHSKPRSGDDFAFVTLHERGVSSTPELRPWPADFVDAICRGPTGNIRELFVGKAPSGEGTFADLAVHDPDDPAQWTVVAVRARPDEIRVLRRVYRIPN
jgi:hypothetical protein